MKVLLIRNVAFSDFGGGERFPVFLAEELSKLDHKVLLVSRSPKLLDYAKTRKIKAIRGWWWTKQNWSGKFVLLFPIYFIWQIILFVWYLQLFIKRQPNIIHVQSKDDFIAATLAGKLLRKRVIWTDHADLKHIWKNVRVWYKNPVGKLVYLVAKVVDSITVVSKSELKLVSANLSKNNGILSKVHVIYNGIVDVSSHYKSNRNKKAFAYCTVSRLVSDKGIKEIIEAFLKINTQHPNTKLIIVGDGPEENKFRKLAKDNRSIKLLGYKSDPLDYMAESDVYLHATYHEGFSVSLVEASMLGRPIVATAIGGNLEIIKDHETGLLIPTKDTDSLYKAMSLLYTDEKLRDKLAKNAREQYLEKFQFNKIVKEKLIPLYEGNKK